MLTLLVIICVLIIQINGEPHSMNGTVYYDSQNNKFDIKLNVIDCTNGVSCGLFNDTLNITGWGNLEIKTTKKSSAENVNDINRMYAAGYLEGYITSYQIANSYFAGWEGEGKNDFGPYQEQIRNWTYQQSVWIKNEIQKNC